MTMKRMKIRTKNRQTKSSTENQISDQKNPQTLDESKCTLSTINYSDAAKENRDHDKVLSFQNLSFNEVIDISHKDSKIRHYSTQQSHTVRRPCTWDWCEVQEHRQSETKRAAFKRRCDKTCIL